MRSFSLLFFLSSAAVFAQPDVSGITQPAGGNPTIVIANEAGTGTTLNTLTKLTGAPSTAIIATAGDTGQVIGVCTAGCGTTGSATITLMGRVSLAFDGSTTANDYIQISAGTNGDGTDAGATYPTSGQVNGRVLSSNVGSGTYSIDLFPSEIKAASGGGGAGTTLFTYVNATGTGPNDSASETSLIGTATTGSKTIPANTMVAGQLLQLAMTGQISTPVAASNLTLNMYMGATKVATGSVTGSNINSLTTQSFTVKASAFVLTGGSSCALVVEDISFIVGGLVAGDLTSFQGTGTTFDCTANQAFDFKAQWGGAQVGQSIFGQGVGLYIPGAPVTSVNGATGAVFTATRGVFASRPSCGSTNNGNVYYSTDIPHYSECNGSAWSDWVRGLPVTLPSSTSFTTYTAPTVVTNGLTNLIASSTGGQSLQGQHVAAPSTPYTIVMTFRPSLPGEGPGSGGNAEGGNFAFCGIEFDDGTKFSVIGLISDAASVTGGSGSYVLQHFFSGHYTNATTLSASNTLTKDFFVMTEEITIAESDDGTNRTFWWVPDWSHSLSLSTWVQLFQESRTTFLTATNVGMVCNANSSAFPVRMVVEDFTTLAAVPH
jgi:hypothetical protein